jgi:toxin ParE1/3/4
MFVPKAPVVLTRAAQRDLREIAIYTLQQWGEEQWATYRTALNRALTTIGDNPQIGRSRDDIRVGYRSFAIEQHLILYRVTAKAVVVSRIVHSRKNIRRALR